MGAFSLIVVINLLNRSLIMSNKHEIVDFFKNWQEQREKFIDDLERRYCGDEEEARALDQGESSAMESGENDYDVSGIADDDEAANLNHAFVQMDTNGVTIMDDVTDENDVISDNDHATNKNDVIGVMDDVTEENDVISLNDDITDENDVISDNDDVIGGNDEDDDDENWEDDDEAEEINLNDAIVRIHNETLNDVNATQLSQNVSSIVPENSIVASLIRCAKSMAVTEEFAGTGVDKKGQGDVKDLDGKVAEKVVKIHEEIDATFLNVMSTLYEHQVGKENVNSTKRILNEDFQTIAKISKIFTNESLVNMNKTFSVNEHTDKKKNPSHISQMPTKKDYHNSTVPEKAVEQEVIRKSVRTRKPRSALNKIAEHNE